MTHKNNFIEDILSDTDIAELNEAVQLFKANSEFELEVGFKKIDYSNYIRIAGELVKITDKSKITVSTSLDAIITLSDGNTFRVSFKNQKLINDFLDKFTNPKIRASISDIKRYLINMKLDIPDVEIMFKDKGSATMIAVPDLDLIFKLTTEIPVTSKTKPTLFENESLVFRLKNRYSFIINKYSRIDVTEVQQSNNIWNLLSRNQQYEIELEIINNKITMKELLAETFAMLKIVQDTDIPISKKEVNEVISEYKKLFNVKYGIHLEKRSTVSIEAHHIVRFIPNKYSCTDKADGERRQLFSTQSGVYLLSNNLAVTKLSLKIDKPQYQNMVLDGELIDCEGDGKALLLFDIVYVNQIDYRRDTKYNEAYRINILDDIVKKCFGTLIPFPNFSDKHTDLDLEQIHKFYTVELKKYWKEFRKQLSEYTKKSELFITRKLHFIPYGIHPCEIFMYADLIWKLYVYQSLAPYKLDGTIMTPLNSPYMIKASKEQIDTIPLEYKWKDPTQNSIDFYIEFEKDKNGADIIFYDQYVKDGIGRVYKIARLFVGGFDGSQERPIPFKVNGIEQRAYIYSPEKIAKDREGGAIDDKTVVEFIFDMTVTSNSNTSKIDNQIQQTDDAYKWIPIKTRYDKTESVTKYNKMYGNPDYIAQRIYRSIINPITESIIALLGNPASFQKEFDRLEKSINSKLIPYSSQNESNFQSKQQNSISNPIYYPKQTDIGAGMRAYHNWIKSNMILTYCKNKPSILDIGCGRGGDINKFISAKVGEVVGLDVDNNGLYVINNCADCRYKSLRRNNPNIPPMIFINANAKGLFNIKSQEKIIPDMNNNNKKLINTYLSGNKKYNVINCQFSLHYYLSDEISWKNFCKNINDHTADNAYFLITTFDGKMIRDKLEKKSKLSVSYTNNSGTKILFAEINKLYADSDTNKIGLAINLYNSMISEPGTYITEYIVEPDFLINSLKKNCGMELVESDSFFNMFNLYKKYFSQDVPDHLDLISGKKQHEIISNYYKMLNPEFKNSFTSEELEMNKAYFAFSSLNRYFVFKKKSGVDLDEPARIVGINNQINLGKLLTPYFESNQTIIDIANSMPRINNFYQNMKVITGGIKPSIYLIRHSILEDLVVNEIFRRNKIELAKIKEGNDPRILLVYKSPDKFFYPIYQKIGNKEQYLFSNNKIISDLDILVALTDKINSI